MKVSHIATYEHGTEASCMKCELPHLVSICIRKCLVSPFSGRLSESSKGYSHCSREQQMYFC